MIINTPHYIIMGILLCEFSQNGIITGWLNVHTPSGRNVAIHVGYTIATSRILVQQRLKIGVEN